MKSKAPKETWTITWDPTVGDPGLLAKIAKDFTAHSQREAAELAIAVYEQAGLCGQGCTFFIAPMYINTEMKASCRVKLTRPDGTSIALFITKER